MTIVSFCLGGIVGASVLALCATTHWEDRNSSGIRWWFSICTGLAAVALIFV